MPLDTLDEKRYGRLLAKHLPAVIESDDEHDRLAEILLEMTIPPKDLSPEEERVVTLLQYLVDEYERRTTAGKLKKLTPVDVLRYLIEEGRLLQSDLIDVFGAQSVVSAVLAGRRAINLNHARRLSRRFHLPIDVFVS